MDESTRAFVLKVIGAIASITLGVAGLTAPPLLATGPVLSGALITGGLLALGVNIGASVAAGREAALLRQTRRDRADPRRPQ